MNKMEKVKDDRLAHWSTRIKPLTDALNKIEDSDSNRKGDGFQMPYTTRPKSYTHKWKRGVA